VCWEQMSVISITKGRGFRRAVEKTVRVPVVVTMREHRVRKRLEALYGRDLTWPEVLRLAKKTV